MGLRHFYVRFIYLLPIAIGIAIECLTFEEFEEFERFEEFKEFEKLVLLLPTTHYPLPTTY